MPKPRLLFLASALFAASTTLAFVHFSRPHPGLLSPQAPKVLSAQNPPQITLAPLEELQSLGILLLGYGGPGHEGSFLTDVIQLVYLDFENSRLALISIPRDLWIRFPDGVNRKINTAFSLGARTPNTTRENVQADAAKSGGENSQAIVSEITGLAINYFIALDFVGLQRAIGELGGLDVQVAETLDDPWYPVQGKELETCGLSPEEVSQLTAKYSGFELEKQFPCRYEHLHFDQGLLHLDGGETLKFVRSRHGSGGGDFSRSQRQQAVLEAIRDKLLSLGAIDDAPKFFSQLAKHVQTNIDESIIRYLAPAFTDIGRFELVNINLSTANVLSPSKSAGGAFILVPKESSNQWPTIQQFISQELEKPHQPPLPTRVD